MEKCPNCGQELPATATEFCPHCGYQLTQAQPTSSKDEVPAATASQAAATPESEPVEPVTNVSTAGQPGAVDSSADSDKGSDEGSGVGSEAGSDREPTAPASADHAKEAAAAQEPDADEDDEYIDVQPSPTWAFIKAYCRSLNNSVIHPHLEAPTGNWDGLINLGLIAVFTSLALARFASKLVNLLMMNLNLMGLNLNLQLKSSLMGFWFILILVLLVFVIRVLALWAYQHLALRQTTSFLTAVNQLFMPISLAVYTSIVGFVLSLVITPSTFLAFLIVAPLILLDVAFVGSLWVNSQGQAGGQRFYLILITVVLTTVILGIVSRMLLGTMLQQSNIMNMMSHFMGN
ncbi:zinc ribbon domain-containing protein [Lapidilactobacillus salsurivasis]